jgi:hypothetical protein
VSVLTTPVRTPSTTPLLLRRARSALVVLTLLVGGAALLVTWKEHTIVVAAGEHTAPAVMQAYAAAQALTDADSQAVQTVPLGAGPSGQYVDPFEQYQADIASAEQSLEQVAENNGAGEPGSQALQLIEGLVPAYTGLVEQADAFFRMAGAGEHGVGTEYLWSASELMHVQILTGQYSLDSLRSAEWAALVSQQSSPWVSPWLNALWIVLALALLGTLAATQYLLCRRLRRMLSTYLTLAAAVVIALCVTTSLVITSEQTFSAASRPLHTVIALQKTQTGQKDRQGQQELEQLIGADCGQCSAEQREIQGIVVTDTQAVRQAQSVAKTCSDGEIPDCVTRREGQFADDAAAAQAGYGESMMLISGLTALLLLLIPLGLRHHLDEYRYEQGQA